MTTLHIAAMVCAILQGGVDGIRVGTVVEAGGEAPRAAQSAASSTLDGLVGYWSFDEGEGGAAANVMGANGDLFVDGEIGTAEMGGASWAEGKFGKAARFRPDHPGVSVGYMEALDCDTAVSIAAWIRLEGPHDEGQIWNYERAYRLALVKGSDRAQFMMDLDGKWAGNWLIGKTRLERGRWYHITCVHDGTERRIYIDGQLDTRGPATGTLSRGGKISIGRHFAGLVDELRVWDRAITEGEVKEVMREDQGRVEALLRPEHALRLYPVRTVTMLGKPGPVEIAVFNSARFPYRGELTFTINAPSGPKLFDEALDLSIPARGRESVRLAFRPKEAGRHALTVRHGDQELSRTTAYVLAPSARRAAGKLALRKVASVDLTRDLGPDTFCDDGASRVVDSPLGRYREAGPDRFSRFVARVALEKPGLHLLRITYPDDRPRVCEITACSPAWNDVYNAQTGYFTGISHPPSKRIQTLECLVRARSVDQWVRFCTWAQGSPAAAIGIDVFEVEGGLPASPVCLQPSQRRIGQYWEDAQPLTWCYGSDGRGLEAFDQAVRNLCEDLEYCGQNVMAHPAVWYDGPIYNSLVESRGTGKGASGGSEFPHTAWMDVLLSRFEERGLRFYAALNVHDLPSLVSAATTEIGRIEAGAPTFNAVTSEGQVSRETWHHRPPAYNAIHPRVKGRVLALVDELAGRHAGSPAFGGVVFHLTKCQLTQLGGLDVGYDDWTTSEFEKDTGSKLPVAPNDPQRFRKRYDWLMANAKERWVQWRCEKIADYYGEVAAVLRRRRPDLELVLSMWVPAMIAPEARERWEQGERLVFQTREAGLDPALLGRIPGVVLQKFMSATDYPWRLALAGPTADKSLRSIRAADFDDGQLEDYRTTDRFGVYLHNRYFENGSMRKAIEANPVRSSWYREPPWLASAVVPAHDHFMEYHAHAMAVFDPALITIGGFTVGTVGHERQVERFARVFRLLPIGKWERIPGLGDQVVGRRLRLDGKRYLYLVNRSATPARTRLEPSVVPRPMKPLGPSPVLDQSERGAEVGLAPYQLAAWIGVD